MIKAAAGAAPRDRAKTGRPVLSSPSSTFEVVRMLPASQAYALLGHGTERPGKATRKRSAAGKGAAQTFVVLSGPAAEARKFEQLLSRVMARANEAGVDAVIKALENAPATADVPASETVRREAWQDTEAARWQEIRADWLRQHPALPAAEIARLASSDTVNPSALLNGWVAAKRVFAVKEGARRLYPVFQIGPDGQPRPEFRILLTALDGRLDGWPLAIWLTRPNAEFENWKTPLEMIERDPQAVAAAALHEVQEAVF